MDPKFGSRSGLSLVEVIIGFFVLAIVLVGTLQTYSLSVKTQGREINRWSAQLSLESVADTLASTSEAQLIALINSECTVSGGVCPPPGPPRPIGNTALFFTSADLAWFSIWEIPNLITDIKVQFKVFDTSGSPVSTELPTTPDSLANFDIQIEVTCVFHRLSDGSANQTLTWTKRITHP